MTWLTLAALQSDHYSAHKQPVLFACTAMYWLVLIIPLLQTVPKIKKVKCKAHVLLLRDIEDHIVYSLAAPFSPG
jgi:MFS-type transporter involved in bile tolerance (Atg22 family)